MAKYQVVIAFALLLQGCTGLFTPPPADTPLAAMAVNQQLARWQLRGKIGLRQHTKAHSAYLNWQQCGEYFDIRLTGPLGQGAAHLFGDSQQVTLKQANQPAVSAPTPEALLTRTLGWSIPVSQLLYWIRGIPEPGSQFIESRQQTGFQQSDWQISYPRLQSIEGYTLPAKAIARQTSFMVTLLLKQWDLHPACELSQ